MRRVTMMMTVAAMMAGWQLLTASTSGTPPPGRFGTTGTSACTANSSRGGGTVTLTAAESMTEMDTIIANDPALAASLAKTTAQFAKAGAKPSGRWTVVHVRGGEQGVVRPVQNMQVWSDVMTVAWFSYDDGDWSTWKGTVLTQNTYTGETGTWDMQNQVSQPGANFMAPLWTRATYWKEPSRRFTSGPSLSNDLHLSFIDLIQPTPRDRTRPLFKSPNWRGYYGCMAMGCSATAFGCAFTGPGAPGCFVGGCTSFAAYCGFGNLWPNLG